MIIPRALLPVITEKLTSSPKGIVLYGARQVGKTTLINQVVARLGLNTLRINGDQTRFLDILSSCDLTKIQSLVAGYSLLFVDEAQRIPEIGLALKIILDSIPNLRVVVTGSSSLDLASKISEPLTGRVWSYHLYPISFLELSSVSNRVELDASLEERMIYGSYPELFFYPSHTQKVEYLRNLSDAYLYKELIEFGEVKNSSKIRDLLKLLAFQVGSLVSLTELGSSLNMSKDTVSRYIELLEKSFILYRLKGFHRNLRKEITKMDKVYFYDTGIRNALIDNFSGLSNRDDVGKLWENFLISERSKRNAYKLQSSSKYFWRTYTGTEVDYVEDSQGLLTGFECKWGTKVTKASHSWLETYPNSLFHLVNRKSYLDFIL